ncbi:hypothetical protein A2U01_0047355, partial [Trifolium medium]|nr:hypothetical protein [Trifolium medium]
MKRRKSNQVNDDTDRMSVTSQVEEEIEDEDMDQSDNE